MATIDFSLIENWLKNHGGKRFKRGELDGSPAREMYKTFVQTIIEGSDFEADYSAWQNSGHTLTYFWAKIRNKAPQKKNSFLGIAVSAQIVNGELEILMRLESEDKKIKDLPLKERKEINRKLLQEISTPRCYYDSNINFQTYPYDKALQIIEDDINYKSPLTFKVRPNIRLESPFTEERSLEIISDAKNVFELFKTAYNKMFENEIFTKQNEEEVNVDMHCELNTILYGPPGTGKTYHTALYAVSIIEETDMDILKKEEYSEILDRYNMYKEAGLIEFTTFHQSYGYEEFIEGIKPVVSDDGEMTYKVVPGVFKRFCDKASTPKSKKIKTNSDPVVWKVSLAKTGDNPVRSECLNNGHVRIGWDEYGEIITEDTDFNNGGKAILNAFINEMREGDIVVSCYSESTADAIGIVTGAYSWNPEYSEYKRVRPVKWIAKGKFNITDINGGKNMTLSAVYKLNNIELEKLYAYVAEETESVVENKDKHVFIIDEINRGNVSKILGEAITLIEAGKRKGSEEELQVTLPYSGKKFGVPKNVYIIGTMNTADRSIALMDTALRRRFNFVEMMPQSELLDGIDIDGVSIKTLLETINNRIHYLYDREHTIGHAYFKDVLKEEGRNIQTLRRILKNNVIPLLQEYFYDDYDKIAQILGDGDKKVFFKEIKASGIVFDGDVKYELDYSKIDFLSGEDIKRIYQ